MVKSVEKTRKRKRKILMGIAFLVIFAGLMLFLLSGENLEILKQLFKKNISTDEVREILSSLGIRGYITISALSMLQVVFTFLPSEPTQVVAGISFGTWRGLAACMAGVTLGNMLIYFLYKIYGQKLTEYFETNAEFDFESARNSSKITLIILILYFLPAIPYGLICIFAASLNMKFPKYMLITFLGSIPSELMGVALGDIAIASSWIISLLVFVIIIALLILLFKYKSWVFQKINDFMKEKENTLKKPSGNIVGIANAISHCIYDGKVKVRFKNNVGRLEKPAIVLCTHGSFIDFVYSGRMLRKEKPYFIAARLYFYKKSLGKLMRRAGCIPKSMFATDLENVKSCMKALSSGNVLVMMPEARLSTAGRFEGIQDSTYKFIQRSNVPVYTLRLNGSYLANPKWGNGARKGSIVEVELNKLYDGGKTKETPIEEMKEQIENALFYDEFEWLKTKPQIAYKSKKLAEGLENILYRCPVCGNLYSMQTKGVELSCEVCSTKTKINNRYAFEGEFPFENLAIWYDWQVEETRKEILQNPDFRLESKVQLRHSSINGKHMTRLAGEGVCVLDKTGLTYKGTDDGVEIEKFFPLSQIYRLLFGAGEDFEIYEGKEIWYFQPEERRSCVAWYVVSGLLKGTYEG